MQPQMSAHGLDGVTIFQDLAPAERARLASELETLTLRRGDVLVREGEPADALYVVVTGRFIVTIAGRRQAISEIGPGQPVGEIAFLAGGVRTATVTALRDSLVLRLRRTEFEELSAKSPSIWHTLTVTLARRVAQANVSRAPLPSLAPAAVCYRPCSWRRLPACSAGRIAPSCSGRRWPRTCCPTACASTARKRRAP